MIVQAIRAMWIAHKFKRLTAPYDRMILEAQRRHMPVNHIRQAKQDYLHDLLRGGRA